MSKEDNFYSKVEIGSHVTKITYPQNQLQHSIAQNIFSVSRHPLCTQVFTLFHAGGITKTLFLSCDIINRKIGPINGENLQFTIYTNFAL